MRLTWCLSAWWTICTFFEVGYCWGQGQQFALDTITEQPELFSMPGQHATATADGGTILFLRTIDGDVQWKVDVSGEPVWCKQYDVSSERRTRMPDGGVVLCDQSGSYTEGDSTYVRFKIVRTDGSGDVIWCRSLIIHNYLPGLFAPYKLFVASDNTGRILITMGTSDLSSYQWFYCLDPDGELLWSRTLSLNLDAGYAEHICGDGLGGWYFGSYLYGAPLFRIGHFNAFGDLTWYRSYEVNDGAFVFNDLTSLDVGAFAVGGVQTWAGDGYIGWFAMRLNLDGSLNWFLRSAPSEYPLQRCGATSSGEVWVSCGVVPLTSNYMALLSGSGEVIGSFLPDTVTVNDVSYRSVFLDWDNHDTTLALSNYLWNMGNDQVPQSHRPGLWRLSISDLTGCAVQEHELSTELMPSGFAIVNDQPASEVFVPNTITDTVCTVTSFSPLQVSDYCSYFTGVPPVVPSTSYASVTTTLLERGIPLTASASGSSYAVTVLDAHGRSLHNGLLAPHATELIQTSAWSPGLYFLRFQPFDGGTLKVVKVVIE